MSCKVARNTLRSTSVYFDEMRAKTVQFMDSIRDAFILKMAK